jgi:hypothetical protein
MIRRSLLFSFFILSICAWAQQKPNVQEGQFTFDTDKPFTLLELDQNDEPIVTKRKSPKEKFTTASKPKKHLPARVLGIE